MAGWGVRVDGSGVEGFNTRQKVQKTEPCFENVSCTNGSFNSESKSDKTGDEKLKYSFNEFLEIFLKEVFGNKCFRPLPPVIGDELEVDLFTLHLVVRQRGGYCSLSKTGSWSLVATDCGFDSSIGPALKLVYLKYLDTLDRWLKMVVKDEVKENKEIKEKDLGFIGLSMELKSDLKEFFSGVPYKIVKEVEFKKKALDSCRNKYQDFLESNGVVKNLDEKWCNKNRGGNVNVYKKLSVNEGSIGDNAVMGSTVADEDPSSRKRKRQCYLNMLNWITKVAKNPGDPAIGLLPEMHKWKHYGSEQQWMQILSAREMILLKSNADANFQQSTWQKKQKMHPIMYDSQRGSESLRCSQRLLFAKDSPTKKREQFISESSPSGCQSDEDHSNSTSGFFDFSGNNHRLKRIPIGPQFQVDLSEFCEVAYESDSKWLGSQCWPLEKEEQNKNLIERDPIGKGRQESCGCTFPGSLQCVKFHVRERRKKIKLELGSAFYKWKFDALGEEVARSWTIGDEKKFEDIVNSNPLSLGKYFWDELYVSFPEKSRETLVSYYFNVFLLRHRGHQNRNNTSNIDSDDEESEFGPIGNKFGQCTGSIFCSPQKSHSSMT